MGRSTTLTSRCLGTLLCFTVYLNPPLNSSILCSLTIIRPLSTDLPTVEDAMFIFLIFRQRLSQFLTSPKSTAQSWLLSPYVTHHPPVGPLMKYQLELSLYQPTNQNVSRELWLWERFPLSLIYRGGLS